MIAKIKPTNERFLDLIEEQGCEVWYTYHIAIREVETSEFGINPANKTRISKAQYSRLIKVWKCQLWENKS